MKGVHNYAFKNYFRDVDEKLAEFNLIQTVTSFTWSRVVQNAHRNSIIDHVYTA
jgi:hypothetical protein